jgi:hypothetical protein
MESGQIKKNLELNKFGFKKPWFMGSHNIKENLLSIKVTLTQKTVSNKHMGGCLMSAFNMNDS